MPSNRDPAVRKLRSSYLEAFPKCQYSEALGHVVLFPRAWGPLVVEHIWNRRSRLSEHWSNYASTLPGPHNWKHDNSTAARIVMSAFKLRLASETGDWSHFDRDALRVMNGFDVPGWIENKLEEDVTLEWWVRKSGIEVVEYFS